MKNRLNFKCSQEILPLIQFEFAFLRIHFTPNISGMSNCLADLFRELRGCQAGRVCLVWPGRPDGVQNGEPLFSGIKY